MRNIMLWVSCVLLLIACAYLVSHQFFNRKPLEDQSISSACVLMKYTDKKTSKTDTFYSTIQFKGKDTLIAFEIPDTPNSLTTFKSYSKNDFSKPVIIIDDGNNSIFLKNGMSFTFDPIINGNCLSKVKMDSIVKIDNLH